MKKILIKLLIALGIYHVIREIRIKRKPRKNPGDQYDLIVNYIPPKIHVDKENPEVVSIEINKNCNLNCTMCNTELSTRDDFNMSLELFENIVKKMVSKGLFLTRLHTIGEPLMNK